jgi:hypothetical protein
MTSTRGTSLSGRNVQSSVYPLRYPSFDCLWSRSACSSRVGLLSFTSLKSKTGYLFRRGSFLDVLGHLAEIHQLTSSVHRTIMSTVKSGKRFTFRSTKAMKRTPNVYQNIPNLIELFLLKLWFYHTPPHVITGRWVDPFQLAFGENNRSAPGNWRLKSGKV